MNSILFRVVEVITLILLLYFQNQVAEQLVSLFLMYGVTPNQPIIQIRIYMDVSLVKVGCDHRHHLVKAISVNDRPKGSTVKLVMIFSYHKS